MSDKQSAQKNDIAQLIQLGREQGYLTHADITDTLPDGSTDEDNFEEITQVLRDMGIKVFEDTPDQDELMLGEDEEMMQDMGREPTPEELSKELDMPEDKVRKVLKIAKEPISTETPIGDDEDSSLGDFIEDTVIESPLENATEESLHFATDDVLASLTAREAKVLRMRFGIGMNTDHTLEEVGKQFDVTRERIRQIEAKALRKLRHPSRSSHLKSFLDE